jgi:GTP cyclohydrolase IA
MSHRSDPHADLSVAPEALEDEEEREARIAYHVAEILRLLGEDIARPGLIDTPRRVAKSLRDVTSGDAVAPETVIKGALFEDPYNDIVLIRDVEFFSLCEHHLLPFYGHAHVAYRPHGRILGLSKIPRLVDMYSRRLQVQERMTGQIAAAVRDATGSPGVGVVIEASHTCIAMRGIRATGSVAVTSCLLGDFEADATLRSELLSALGRSS